MKCHCITGQCRKGKTKSKNVCLGNQSLGTRKNKLPICVGEEISKAFSYSASCLRDYFLVIVSVRLLLRCIKHHHEPSVVNTCKM